MEMRERNREQPESKAVDPGSGQSWGWARQQAEGSGGARGDGPAGTPSS